MYLKSLVLKGFKSFADRSVLKLEPGMTVVVGPNGSGKSNVSDAVLWVLGEQSAKQLRGQAMEDVIFAGSSARKPVGLAEVDLVLDNSDGTLPLDFNEVVITRRMYRSGESEYLINGSPSRLMDVLDILNDSGLGRDTHSIISQGSLQNVLRARPEDRRLLIEEAAGILKHKKRKERSSRKLKNMDVELQRVHDIAGEIDRQLKPLERQASRARQHEQISGELKEVELALAVDDLRLLQAQWGGFEKQEKEADAQTELMRFRLEEKNRELEKSQRLLEEKGLFVGDLAEQRRRCQMVLERLDAGMLLLEEKGRNMVARLSELRQTIHRSETRKAEATELFDRYEAERRDAVAKMQELQSQLDEHKANAESVRKQRKEADRKISQLSADVRSHEKGIDECTLKSMRASESLSTADVEDDLLRRRAEQIEGSFNAMQTTLGQRRAHLGELESQLSQLQKDSEAAKSDIDKRVRLVEDAQKALDTSREHVNAVRAEAKALEEVDRAFDHASPMLSWALDHRDDIDGIVLPLNQIFTAPPELEQLVEHLLGTDMFGLMMEDAHAAGALARELLGNEVTGGELSLISLQGEKVVYQQAESGTRLLDELDYDSRYDRVAELLLGDVYLVDSIEQAVAASEADASGSRFVTSDGIVAWPDGKITIGTQVTDAEGVLGRKRRLTELADEEPREHSSGRRQPSPSSPRPRRTCRRRRRTTSSSRPASRSSRARRTACARRSGVSSRPSRRRSKSASRLRSAARRSSTTPRSRASSSPSSRSAKRRSRRKKTSSKSSSRSRARNAATCSDAKTCSRATSRRCRSMPRRCASANGTSRSRSPRSKKSSRTLRTRLPSRMRRRTASRSCGCASSRSTRCSRSCGAT